MEGYILLNERGWKLTRYCFWSRKPEAGWLWTFEEAERLLYYARTDQWKYQPYYWQYCQLFEETDGDVNVYAINDMQPL